MGNQWLEKVRARQGHFASPSLLHTQLMTLEEPPADAALRLDIALPIDTLVERTLAGRGLED